MKAADRMVRVLRYLAEHGGSAKSIEIRRGVPAYEDDSGRRLWTRDLGELRARGLVAPKRPGQRMSSLVELAPLRKPQHLFLSGNEHDVLTEARDRLPQTCPVPSPLPEESSPELHNLARLTRYLEERPGRKLTYDQVERALGLGRDQLADLLRQIVEPDEEIRDYTRRHPALDWIDYLPPDAEDPDGCICNVDAAAVLGEAFPEAIDPRERTTGQLGFWAYSMAETDDRLELIDRALAELDLGPHQQHSLQSARRKLREWKTLLPPG